MGTVTVTLPADGTTADVADYNTPLNTLVNEFNGNVDNANIKSNAAIATSKLASDGFLATWSDWIPTYQGLSLGNGTLSFAKYIQIGKTVFFAWQIIYGSTTSHSDPLVVSLPVTPSIRYSISLVSQFGMGIYGDTSSGAIFQIQGLYRSGSPAGVQVVVLNVASTYGTIAGIGGSVPVAAGTSDNISMSGFYEAA